jgi:RNA polymerase sigma-70 factor, ECF subfamily
VEVAIESEAIEQQASDHDDPSDTQLVASTLAGDIDGFRQLYERHYALAVGVARSRLYDVHLAEDAAQEAFSIALRTLATLEKQHRFAQWLGTIVRRTADVIARKSRKHATLVDDMAQYKHEEDNDMPIRLRESLGSLDERSREIVILHYFSELSYQQIAEVTQLSTQAIHGRLQRARRTLRDALLKEE